MRYCRFQTSGQPQYGLIERTSGTDMITRIIAFPEALAASRANTVTEFKPMVLADAHLLAPVQPSKIICVGRNYREHARELGNEPPSELLIFMKPPSSVLAPDGEIKRPRISERVDHEGELGVVIGKECHRIGHTEDVRSYIRGYTCVNDVTARDLQKKDGQWTRAKGFDTFCPLGPVVTDEVDPWRGVTVETQVNGELRQRGTTADFIFPLDAIIRYISSVMTLFPGDLIATGTPSGVGPLVAGDVVAVSVEGVGTLRNRVVDEPL